MKDESGKLKAGGGRRRADLKPETKGRRLKAESPKVTSNQHPIPHPD